jgi:HEAT repeat protein
VAAQYQVPSLDVVENPDLVALVTGDPLPFLADEKPPVRRLAVNACIAHLHRPAVRAAVEARLAGDPDERVRAEAAGALATTGAAAFEVLWAARGDGSPIVVEAVAAGLGETGDGRAVDWLVERARHDDDPAVREAAVAALGAIGDPAAAPVLIELAGSAKPQIRRRAVVALTAFDGPEVEGALRRALLDRNPMVREVAEMVLGR